MDATAINALCEVLANAQTHPYLRLKLIISIQLHFTTDSLDPTLDVHRFHSVQSFTCHLTYSAGISLLPNCAVHGAHFHLISQRTYLTSTWFHSARTSLPPDYRVQGTSTWFHSARTSLPPDFTVHVPHFHLISQCTYLTSTWLQSTRISLPPDSTVHVPHFHPISQCTYLTSTRLHRARTSLPLDCTIHVRHSHLITLCTYATPTWLYSALSSPPPDCTVMYLTSIWFHSTRTSSPHAPLLHLIALWTKLTSTLPLNACISCPPEPMTQVF